MPSPLLPAGASSRVGLSPTGKALPFSRRTPKTVIGTFASISSASCSQPNYLGSINHCPPPRLFSCENWADDGPYPGCDRRGGERAPRQCQWRHSCRRPGDCCRGDHRDRRTRVRHLSVRARPDPRELARHLAVLAPRPAPRERRGRPGGRSAAVRRRRSGLSTALGDGSHPGPRDRERRCDR